MAEHDRREEVVAVARMVLERAAPDQSPDFDGYARAWLADPKRAMAGHGRRERPLGAGTDIDLPNLAPMILFVVHHVLDAAFVVGAEEGVRRGARAVFGRRAKKAEAAAGVEARDTEEVRERAVTAGKEFGAPAETVTLVANIVVVVVTSESSSPSAPGIPQSESERTAEN